MDEPRLEKLYNIRAMRGILGAPRVTVIRWIREGRLRAFKLPGGRLWRVKESDLVKFIEGGKP
jgi:excisionase family DNA binding protein